MHLRRRRELRKLSLISARQKSTRATTRVSFSYRLRAGAQVGKQRYAGGCKPRTLRLDFQGRLREPDFAENSRLRSFFFCFCLSAPAQPRRIGSQPLLKLRPAISQSFGTSVPLMVVAGLD